MKINLIREQSITVETTAVIRAENQLWKKKKMCKTFKGMACLGEECQTQGSQGASLA